MSSGRIGGGCAGWCRRGPVRGRSAARSAPTELRGLRQPVEGLRRALELDRPDARRQEVEERAEERGLADLPGLGGDDDRDAALDKDPQRRRQLRIERAGTQQLHDGARRRWHVANGPPAPRWRGVGQGSLRTICGGSRFGAASVRPTLWSVKRCRDTCQRPSTSVAYHRAHGARHPAAHRGTHPRPRDAVRPGWRPEMVLVRVVPGPWP